ncbi:hypothetical protein BBP00_00004259 [Phytophthora kernoviae]|uniref:Ribonuclease H1 N-terminal domain-containing protein n=1 Tax=Phytophthora kernoviae TaxID=325452 RepID=A0A3F2RS81_9STRA|nr:hypothetical protein BBP00_00004259 [Phytophthora kernoviae]
MSFYAVAVVRRVGIYKNWGEAIKQVYQYSACSLKKFSTYQEAEYFLRRHQWQPPLTSTKDFKNISDKKDNSSDTASETDSSCSDPEDDDEDVAEATKKRGRDQEKDTIEELSVEFATMEECETSGWNAALSEDQGLVERILDEKIGHRINWVHLNDDTMDSMNWAPKWSDLAYRKAFEAAQAA